MSVAGEHFPGWLIQECSDAKAKEECPVEPEQANESDPQEQSKEPKLDKKEKSSKNNLRLASSYCRRK